MEPFDERPNGSERTRRSRTSGSDREHASAPTDDLAGWLRGLTWTLGPVAVGTALDGGAVNGHGVVGGHCRLAFDVTNRQRAATSVALRPSTLRSDDGTEWRPTTTTTSTTLLTAGETRRMRLTIEVPDDLPAATYRGALIGLATRGDAPALTITVATSPATPTSTPTSPAAPTANGSDR